MKTRLTSYFPACLLSVSSDNHGINCETEHLATRGIEVDMQDITPVRHTLSYQASLPMIRGFGEHQAQLTLADNVWYHGHDYDYTVRSTHIQQIKASEFKANGLQLMDEVAAMGESLV